MNAERLLSTFLDMVRISSPSRHEARFAAHCRRIFESMGATVRFDEAGAATGSDTGNLIAEFPGTREGHLVLSAHMDTVMPGYDIEPVIEGSRIVSAGETVLGADDKAGIAAIVEALRCVFEEGVSHPRITVVLTVCEELSLFGCRSLRP